MGRRRRLLEEVRVPRASKPTRLRLTAGECTHEGPRPDALSEADVCDGLMERPASLRGQKAVSNHPVLALYGYTQGAPYTQHHELRIYQ
jgi:hypothetical protein